MKKRFLPFGFFLGFLSLSITILGVNGTGLKEKEMLKNPVKNNQRILESSILHRLRVNQYTGIVDPKDYMTALKQLASLNKESKAEQNWTGIGPDNYGGRTRAIIYDNQDASGTTVYAAAVTGGIWKSTDNGISWNKINTTGSNLYVSCMTQADNGTIYVGTGELFNANFYSMFDALGYSTGFMGTGLYKSTDGDHFELISSTEPNVGDAQSEWAFINEVQVDKNGRIYAATNTGLKYSDNDGASWAYVKDTAGVELMGVALDVKVGEGVVLTTIDGKCYYSNGDADSFKLLSTGEEGKLPDASEVSRVEFAVAPSNQSIVYANIIKMNGNLYGVYRSENGGADWSIVLPGSESLSLYFYGGMYYNTIEVFPDNPDKILLGAADLWVGYKTNESGLFYWEEKSTFFASPLSSLYLPLGHHVYAFRPGHPNEFMVGTSSGIFKGMSNGENFEFTDANKKYYTTQFYKVGYSGLENYVVGGSNENSVIIMDQQSNSVGYGRTILGFQNGFLNTTNGGDAAISLINPNILVVGAANGKIFRSEDKGENYSVNFTSEGIELNSNFYTPFALWESFHNENSRDSVWFYARGNSYPGGSTLTVKSNNSDYPFKYTLPDDVSLNPGDSILVCDPVSSRLFVAGKHHVYMTKTLHQFDHSTEWFEIANAYVGYYGTASAVAYSSDANHLFVGTTEGKLFRISNLALAYNKALADVNEPTCIVAVSEIPLTDPASGNPISQAITSISVDPQNPEKVLVTLGNYGNENYVFYTENALAQTPTFESKQGNLPKIPAYSSVIEMNDENLVILGTDLGLFMTEQIGASNVVWEKIQSDMGTVPVMDLAQQVVAQKPVTLDLNGTTIEFPGATNFGIIYAATYGRGIYRCNDYRKPVGIGEIYSEKTNPLSLNVYPNPANQVVNVKMTATVEKSVTVRIVDLSGRTRLEKSVQLNKGENNLVLNVSNLSKGSYLLMIHDGSSVMTKKIVKN